MTELPAWIVPGCNSAVSRRAYIDWARGIAVLLMIEAHTVDAWTRAVERHSIAFRDLTVLGGLAAPLFLWLAGLGVAMSASRIAVVAVEAACRRGLEIFILAFLFRLQGFVITPGGSPLALFRVDVLNIMGPAMIAAGLLWGLARAAAGRVMLYALAASSIAMVTPIVRTTRVIRMLPIWVQWYLRPAGDLTTFTLFPWAGFVLAGAAVGALLAAASDERVERRLHIALGASGAALIAYGFYAAGRPSIYRVSAFWTSSPTWFAIRVGILMVSMSAIFAVWAFGHEDTKTRNMSLLFRAFVLSWQRPLARLGRASLFIYWIHVELVYGYTTWLIRSRLPLWGTAIAYVAFCAVMYGAIVLRDRLVAVWRARRAGPTPQPARQADAASEASV
jgi:uncharacterized membrane protein